MTRNRLLVIGGLAAAGLVAGLLLVFLGGDSNPPVAHVAGETIRRDRLDVAVEHFRNEAKSEGTPFPDESSDRFRPAASVPYHAIATVPGEPPWTQMNSFVTDGQELT